MTLDCHLLITIQLCSGSVQYKQFAVACENEVEVRLQGVSSDLIAVEDIIMTVIKKFHALQNNEYFSASINTQSYYLNIS